MSGKVQRIQRAKFSSGFLLVAATLLVAPNALATAPTLPPPLDGATATPQVPTLSPTAAGWEANDALLAASATGLVAVAVAIFFVGGARFVTPENILDNPARRHVFQHVLAHSGVPLRTLASRLEMKTTSLVWHLRKLEKARLIASQRFDSVRVYYAVEGGLENRRHAVASRVLSNPNAVHILGYLASHGTTSQREIARALHVNHGTIRWHLRKLHEAELVHNLAHGSRPTITPLGHETLRRRAARVIHLTPPPVPPTVHPIEVESGAN